MSEGMAWGLGLLMAMFGPLFLLLPVWLIHRLLSQTRALLRLGIAEAKLSRSNIGASFLLVALIVAATYAPGRLEFNRLCEELAEPRIRERVQVDGFLLMDTTADSFGRRYLTEEGFRWFETPVLGRPEQFRRFRREGDQVVIEKIEDVTARYRLASLHEERAYGIKHHRTVIGEISSGRALAESDSLTYMGGPLGMFLGIYGMSTCPSPITPEGSRQFNLGYHLAREVLGGAPGN